MEIQNQDSHFPTAQNRLRRKEKNCRLHKPLDTTRTGDEYGALLASAGLHIARIVPTQSPLSIIEAQSS